MYKHCLLKLVWWFYILCTLSWKWLDQVVFQYLQEHYGEDAYNLTDSEQDEADYDVEEYLEEKSESMEIKNIIRMAYYDNEPYPVDGSQQEKEDFEQWKIEAEQFNDYVYNVYSYKEDTGFYNDKNNNFENNFNLKMIYCNLINETNVNLYQIQ